MSYALTGRLICATEAEAAIVRAHLPRHIALSRAEPGNLRFNVDPAGPLVWVMDEEFVNEAAFRAHQQRGRDSEWGRLTAGIRREIDAPPGTA